MEDNPVAKMRLVRQLQRAVEHVTKDVEQVQQTQHTVDHPMLLQMCIALEQILNHGLKQALLFGSSHFWDLLQHIDQCIPEGEELLRQIKSRCRTKVGRTRVFVCMALNEKGLVEYLNSLLWNVNLCTQYYLPEAVLLDQECCDNILAALESLRAINFSLDAADKALDMPNYWSTFRLTKPNNASSSPSNTSPSRSIASATASPSSSSTMLATYTFTGKTPTSQAEPSSKQSSHVSSPSLSAQTQPQLLSNNKNYTTGTSNKKGGAAEDEEITILRAKVQRYEQEKQALMTQHHNMWKELEQAKVKVKDLEEELSVYKQHVQPLENGKEGALAILPNVSLLHEALKKEDENPTAGSAALAIMDEEDNKLKMEVMAAMSPPHFPSFVMPSYSSDDEKDDDENESSNKSADLEEKDEDAKEREAKDAFFALHAKGKSFLQDLKKSDEEYLQALENLVFSSSPSLPSRRYQTTPSTPTKTPPNETSSTSAPSTPLLRSFASDSSLVSLLSSATPAAAASPAPDVYNFRSIPAQPDLLLIN